MKRKIWKRLIAVGCAASLFMTTPVEIVFASELEEDTSVIDEIESENGYTISDRIAENDGETDSIDDSDEKIGSQNTDSVSVEEIAFDEVDSSDDTIIFADETINEDEELVGAYVTPDFNSCVSSYSELESRLETLKSWYVGSYWTTDGQPANSSGSTSLSYYGIQCNGFAKLIFTDLFNTGSIGSYDSNKYYFPNANGAYLIDKNASIGSGDANAVKAILQYGEIGDFIQVHRRGKDYGHSMILTGKDDEGIWIFDCNSDGHCKVQHYYQSYSKFATQNDKMSLYRSVNYPPKKLTAELSVERKYYNPGDTVTFRFGGENTNGTYTLGIYKELDRYKTVEVKSDSYSIQFDEVASYSAYMTSYGNGGLADSNWVDWQVLPLTAEISADKTKCNVNDQVTLSFNGYNNQTFANGEITLAVWCNDELIFNQNVKERSYVVNCEKPGEYKAYMTAYGGGAYKDSNWVNWTAYPLTAEISADKTKCNVNDQVTLSFNGYNNQTFANGEITLAVWCNDELIFNQNVKERSYVVNCEKPGEYKAYMTAYGGGAYKDSNWVNWTAYVRTIDIGNATVTGITNKTYNGSAQTQNPTVKVGDKTLTSGTDYTLSYSNNTNAGTATVTITGKGNYSGSLSKTFTISCQSISNASVTGISNKTYNGSAQTQNPTVKVSDKTLTSGTDYTVGYSNNVNVGTATVTMTGKGNYTGSISKTFTISALSGSGAIVTGISNKTYNGSAQTQNPTVKVNDKTLIAGTDYTLSYSDNTNAGTAKVTITFKGNYTGSVNKTFTISALTIENASVTGITNKTYTGSSQTQNPIVKVGDKTLTSGTDYTLSYTNNTNAGTATVTITGKGNYTGSTSKTFTINKAAPKLTFASASVSKTSLDAAFTNQLTKTTDGTVTFASGDENVATVDNDGLVTIKGIGTTTITATAAAGKNYKAGNASYTLTVVDGRIAISTCTITLSSTSYTYNGSAKKPTVTVKNGSTTLKSGTDYTVAYKNNTNAGTATATVTGKGNYTGTSSKNFTINKAAASLKFASASVEKTTLDAAFTNELTKTTDGTVTFASDDEKVATVDNAGLVTIKGIGTTTITATAAAGKNYKVGNVSYTLTVVDGRIDISTCTITLSATSYTYNGKAKKPTVTVKDGNTTLKSGTDYTVAYKNNTNAGTATVTVTGKGKYTGSVSKKYTIKKAAPSLKFAENAVSKTILDEAFTNELTKTTDGVVAFKSNDKNIADVDSTSGLVTIKGVGTAVITATAAAGKNYSAGNTSYALTVHPVSIEKASVGGVSLSYGYSGKAYTPTMTVKVNGVVLTEGTDYTVKIENNKNPGTATITLTGKGNYTGTRIKTFEIVDCVSSLVSGRTYQLIPKNNSKTAVCSYSGKMVNNTKVYITDRSNSEAMKFKAVKSTDGTWKFINAKCELALAVQQNSSEIGVGTVLYDQTTKKAQNWKLSKKSDNSWAIMNAVTGYSIAMSDESAVKGTTLSMAETQSNGLQRFYIAETDAVDASFDGTYAVKASKDKTFALNIDSSSKEEGANVNLYSYSNTNAKKFKAIYSGSGYYRLVNVNSGLVVSVEGNTKKDGANLVQSKWAAQSGQRWKITQNYDGTVTLTNVLGTNLHLSGNKTANGTNVIAKNASTSTAQRWYLQ